MKDEIVKVLKEILPTRAVAGGIPIIQRWDYNAFAEKLINKGALFPPCKNGDKIYFSKAELQEVCPAKVIAIKDNYYSPSCRFWITVEYDSQLIGKQTVEMTADVFKLLCRKTKEAAETKLKESCKC